MTEHVKAVARALENLDYKYRFDFKRQAEVAIAAMPRPEPSLNGNAELVERVAEQMHYAACEFASPDTPLDTIKATFPWQALDARRRDGCLAMARAAIAALSTPHGDAK